MQLIFIEDISGFKRALAPVQICNAHLFALDCGFKKVGIAHSGGVFGLPSFAIANLTIPTDNVIPYLNIQNEKQKIDGIVIGLPKTLDGANLHKTYIIGEAFAEWIIKTLAIPVLFWDESFSTMAANDEMYDLGIKHKGDDDHYAAKNILQWMLDISKKSSTIDNKYI